MSPAEKLMGFVVFVTGALVASWFISEYYRNNCTGGDSYEGRGSAEFNLAFFGFAFLWLGFVTSEPLFFLLSAVLLGFVIRNFVANWDRSG